MKNKTKKELTLETLEYYKQIKEMVREGRIEGKRLIEESKEIIKGAQRNLKNLDKIEEMNEALAGVIK